MPDERPNLFSRRAHGQIGHKWIWQWSGKSWFVYPWWRPIDPNPPPPVYEGMAAYQLTLRDLWKTTVNQNAWYALAHHLRIAPFHAFQKVNMSRYLKNLPTTLVPI